MEFEKIRPGDGYEYLFVHGDVKEIHNYPEKDSIFLALRATNFTTCFSIKKEIITKIKELENQGKIRDLGCSPEIANVIWRFLYERYSIDISSPGSLSFPREQPTSFEKESTKMPSEYFKNNEILRED
jgi:hypothetical protein